MVKTYKFVKQGKEWYIDLPDYLKQGGSTADLQMVDGADKMLDMMAGNEHQIVLNISKEPFEGADNLVLIEKYDPYIGGGNYLMASYEGHPLNQNMWLCQVTEFVFGEIPELIFVRKEDVD